MGVETALAVGAGAGALGGIVKGAKGTPDQNTVNSGNSSSTSQLQLGDKSPVQTQLEGQSLSNYNAQNDLVNQLQNQLGSADQYQQQAQQQAQSILNGSAFNPTQQEQDLISQIRNSQLTQGTADINDFLNQRINAINAAAGQRGIRGQALSQLQMDATKQGTQQLGALQNQLNAQQASQLLQAPLSRIQAQSPYLQQGLTFADQLRQQALANRQQLQNPYLLQLLQQQRIATGQQTQTGTNNGNATQLGQPGSFADALLGGLTGGLGGGTAGLNVVGGMANLNLASSLGDQLRSGANAGFQTVPGPQSYSSPLLGNYSF